MAYGGFDGIVRGILDGTISTPGELDEAKRQLGRSLGLSRFIRNSEILNAAAPDERKLIRKFLTKKPTRTLSGVAVVAAMTMPHKCPHGRCKYCPGGVDHNVPQSYTGKEPAARRAIQYGFDPYLQTTFRLSQLKKIGHPVDKAELIVMGGTLTAQSIDYQDWFTKKCLMAMNDFTKNHEIIGKAGEAKFISQYKSSPQPFKYREDAQEENETADVRCVGITFEPRPDWARCEQIDYMLEYGVTRVEIGVQNPDDKLYEEIERGHTVKDVADATRELKDAGLKVGYHLMPGLKGYDPETDIGIFKRVFTDQRFKPDMIKIYPCIVMEGTEFSIKYNKGQFKPLSTGEAVEIIAKAKTMLPRWVRTMRIMRDIPSNIVEAGIKNSNLGQLVYDYMGEHEMRCECIRCREVGRRLNMGEQPEPADIRLKRIDYDASCGREIFLSFEDARKDILIGFTRLRIPQCPHRPEINGETALIRELHVYGPMVELGEKPLYEWQHRGYGEELIREAEEIAARQFNKKNMIITSGVGVRNYYRRLGYERRGPYMGKTI
jgi:elongator complex protein 3